MTQKKLPRDLMGILFYVFGWIIGLTIKGFLALTGYALKMVYSAFKRDQFNRRLRVAVSKTEIELEPLKRALGREELRYLVATIGLSNASWHQSVKLRRRTSEIVNSVCASAVERNDLNQLEAGSYIDEVNRFLFLNFDRHLLTTENKKSRKRFSRISKTSESEESIIVSEPIVKDIYTTNKLIDPSAKDNSAAAQPVPAENRGLKVDSFSSVSATEWAAADEEPLVN